MRAEVGVRGPRSGREARPGDPRGGRRLLPALSAEDGSDDSSRRGHFLLGWMRRSRRRRGGDRTEDGPCRGEVSPGLAARPLRWTPPSLGGIGLPGVGDAQRATSQPSWPHPGRGGGGSAEGGRPGACAAMGGTQGSVRATGLGRPYGEASGKEAVRAASRAGSRSARLCVLHSSGCFTLGGWSASEAGREGLRWGSQSWNEWPSLDRALGVNV